ncbi:MAG TPA: hypothetical protein VKV03_01200 [Candidatus Binataceae bacterium]|nr:hypothetical protein [Candidatus Binataceae bacterium]
MRRFTTRRRERGATQLAFLDIVTAIVVLAILVYAATRQFPAYHTAAAPAPATSQAH